MLASIVPAHRAWAAGKDDDEEKSKDDEDSDDKASDDKSSDDESSDDESDDESSDEDSAPKGKAKSSAKDEEEAETIKDDGLRPKQDSSGHDLGTKKTSNEFERD